MNRLFVLPFENDNDRVSHATYYLPKVEIKDYNVMIDGGNFFDQPANNINETYENIRKIAIGKGNDYITGCLLDYLYFKENCKMIAIVLSKQQALDADPRKIQQINFTVNLDRGGNTTIVFIIEQEKETIFEFSQGTVKFLRLNFSFSLYKITQCNTLNMTLSNSQLHKLKPAIKNETEVVLRLSPKMIGDSNDKTNFPHELLLTDRQVSSIRKAFANNSSADIKLSKTPLSTMMQPGGFLSKLLGPLLKTGLPLIKHVITPLAKSVLIPLVLTAADQQHQQGYIKKY